MAKVNILWYVYLILNHQKQQFGNINKISQLFKYMKYYIFIISFSLIGITIQFCIWIFVFSCRSNNNSLTDIFQVNGSMSTNLQSINEKNKNILLQMGDKQNVKEKAKE